MVGLLVGGVALALALLGPPPPGSVAEAPAAASAPAAPPQTEATQAAPPSSQPPPAPAGQAATQPPPAAPGALPGQPPGTPRPMPSAAPRPGTIAGPDPALLEPGPHGPLPRVGPEGRSALRHYARGFTPPVPPRPRIALVVGGVGLNVSVAEAGIAALPPAVTLALDPYAPRIGALAELARARGMEFLLSLPLEPAGFPQNDPGDRAILTGQTPAQQEDRLFWLLSRVSGYVGASGALGGMRGERFAELTEPFHAMQDQLRRRGLLYLDPRPGARPPARAWGRAVDVVVDDPPGRAALDAQLAALEAVARERGTAVGLAGDLTPVLVERVAAWAEGLEARGAMLAPLSSMLRRPEGVQ